MDNQVLSQSLILRMDAEGYIVYAPHESFEMLGCDIEHIMGHPIDAFWGGGAEGVSLFESIKTTLAHEKIWIKDTCIKNKEGSLISVHVCVVPVKKKNQITGYASTMDIVGAPKEAASLAGHGLPGEGAQATQKNQEFTRLFQLLRIEKYLSVKNGILAGIVFVSLMMLAGGILGMGGLALSTRNMETIFHEKLDPVRILGRINFLMADNRAQVALALHHNPESQHKIPDDHLLESHIASTEMNREEINALWATYTKIKSSEELQNLMQEYWVARMDYVNDGLEPMIKMLLAGQFSAAEKLLLEKVNPLYNLANAKSESLLAHLTKQAEWGYQEVAQRNFHISILASLGIAMSLAIIAISGFLFFQGTVHPLNTSVQALEKIAEGDLSGKLEWLAYGEPGRVTASVLAMQVNLKVMIEEIQTSSRVIQKQCQQMNGTVMNLAQRFEEQHDRVYQALNISSASAAHLREQAVKIQAAVQSCENLSPQDAAPVAEAQLLHAFAELAASMGMDVFSAEETSEQMNQIAMLIVENREEVQKAWSASEQLRNTSHELDRLVGRFTT